MTDLSDLIERLEGAEQGSPELSREVRRACGLNARSAFYDDKCTEEIGSAIALCERMLPGAWTMMKGPRSALPEGSPVSMGDEWRFVIELRRAPYTAVGDGRTRPIAVVSALLRALQQKEG